MFDRAHVDETFGRYRLLERLGQGGMAEVFRAKSYGVEGFEKVVVIKRVLPDLAQNRAFSDLFVREAKLAVRLSHANIVQVFDLGMAPAKAGDSTLTAPAYYMAMEYVHGLDVAALLANAARANKPIPVEIAAYIASEAAKGLDYAHRRRDDHQKPLGIVHCDVSPQNVLLSLEGEVKVTDFGIARALGALDSTHTHPFAAKSAYMSPEQASGAPFDFRSDLFSLGVVLYELLSGVNPFSGLAPAESTKRILEGVIPKLRSLRPSVPQDLASIVDKALSKDAGDRFSDAGKMHDSLLAFIYATGHRASAQDLATLVREHQAGEEPIEPRTIEAFRATEDSPPDPASMVSTISEPPASVADGRIEVTALALSIGNTLLHSAVEEIVARYGGKFVEREFKSSIALFGIDARDGRDVESAVRAALVIQRVVGRSEAATMGVHIGRLEVQKDGSIRRDEGMFRSLLEASRQLLEASSGACVISREARRAVRQIFSFEEVAEDARGCAVVTGTRPLALSLGKMVGREAFLNRFATALSVASGRSSQTIVIRGDQGQGKTRLVVEFEQRLKRTDAIVNVHIATCPPQGRSVPFSGIETMIRSICRLEEGESVASDTLLPEVRSLGLREDESTAILSLLGERTLARGENFAQSLQQAVVRMFTRLSDDSPRVFAWDSANALDDESIGIIEALTEQLKDTRSIFLFSGRPDAVLEKLCKEPSDVFALEDLTESETERLLSHRLNVDEVPAELLTFVRERAGGHPLFVEELAKAISSANCLTISNRKVAEMRIQARDLGLPRTLRGLVGQRVAQLSSSTSKLIHALCMLGERVEFAWIGPVSGLDESEIRRAISELVRKDFLIQTTSVAWHFKSPLVREIIKESLTTDQAKDLHRRVANFFSVDERSRLDRAHDIAVHLALAGESSEASQFFAVSATRSLDLKHFEAGAKDLTQAVLLSGSDLEPQVALEWITRLAQTVPFARPIPEAEEVAQKVLAVVDRTKIPTLQVKARIGASILLTAKRSFDTARGVLSSAEQLATQDPSLAPLVWEALGYAAARKGEVRKAVQWFARRLEASRSFETRLEEHAFYVAWADALAATGEKQRAVETLARAEELLPDDRRMKSCRLVTRARLDLWSGEGLRESAASALVFAREAGLVLDEIASMLLLGECHVRNQEFSEAYGVFRRALALAEESAHERFLSVSRMFLSFLDTVAGDEESYAVFFSEIGMVEERDFTDDRMRGLWLSHLLLNHREAKDAAIEAKARLRQLAQDVGCAWYESI